MINIKKNQKFGLVIGLLVVITFGGIFALQQSFETGTNVLGRINNNSSDYQGDATKTESQADSANSENLENQESVQENVNKDSGAKKVTKYRICPTCEGAYLTCAKCGGTGYITYQPEGKAFKVTIPCSQCDGTGLSSDCPTCGGTGKIPA